MKLNFLFILTIAVLSACATKVYPDLSHYTVDDFLNHRAYCTNKSQCRYIGYGEANIGCPSNPVFQGLVVYSTTMGPDNIRHLENLAEQSRFFQDQSFVNDNALVVQVSFEEEVCLGISNHKPKLICLDSKCVDNFWNEL